MKMPLVLAACCGVLAAETHTLTLSETLKRAANQSPQILIARFEEAKAAEAVREVRDPFSPQLGVGSGLAYSSGFPLSIDNSAPSILQARARQTLYDRSLSYQVASAREMARSAALGTAARREEVLLQVANLHLAAERTARTASLLRQQLESLQRIADSARARIAEGRELPVEGRIAELRLAQVQQRLRVVGVELEQQERAIAVALGMGAEDRVHPAGEERAAWELPDSETTAPGEAVATSRELRRLESELQARQLQATAGRSARYPKVDLVAQYALLAKFNNYEEFFRRFQRHNGQIGMSFQLPVFVGSAVKSQIAQAELDMAKLRVQINAARERLAADARKLYQDWQLAQSSRELAKLELDVTREQLGVALAQFGEGRLPLREVENLRTAEAERWLAFYDAQASVERAALALLHGTGSMMAAVR